MLSPDLLSNAGALAKLAALNPLAEGAAASSSAAAHGRKEGKRTITSSGADTVGADRIGGDFMMAKDAPWLKTRNEVLEQVVQRAQAAMESVEKVPIQVTLPDGKVIDGTGWVTSPLDIANSISKGLAQATCVSSVRYSKRLAGGPAAVMKIDDPDGEGAEVASEWELWDLARPLEGDCQLKLHKFEDAEGKETFWHSSAHILGEALESLYGARLTHGPPTDAGFFYDSFMGSSAVTPEMTTALEKRAKAIADEKQPYERIVVTKEECLALFAANPFKQALISSKLPDGSVTSVYRCGSLVDLCKGPHLPNTSRIKAFTVTKTSATQWLGKAGNDELQRVYGISFPDKKGLAEWKHLQEEAAKRDHRKIGVEQQLLFFDELSPGSCFFLPHGCRLYNRLMQTIREQYWMRGYDEVVTPNMYNLKLWETSGHAAKYKDNMFCLDIEGQEFGLKPMNCPGHCIMFKHTKRSYKELPIRYADFGVLHRNELSGALTGLTRVRRFQQDDAHIFCMVSQIKEEVANVLDMIATVYNCFGMDFSLKLSTKPESALGDAAIWDKAEALMEEALDEFKGKTGRQWSLNPGDGAFYGPKIDIQVVDALKRAHQCATVQLDFVQPMRFDLKYQTAGGDGDSNFERPVMIHRAVLGSVERMIAILIEHYAGKWPLFLSPRQAMIVPVTKLYTDYAFEVQKALHAEGFYAEVDSSQRTLAKMVREAQVTQYNFILVVGQEEAEAKGVKVRARDTAEGVSKSLVEFIAELKQMLADHL